MQKYFTTYRKPLGYVGAVLAVVVAIIYYFVVPSSASEVSLFQRIILTYGHTACWLSISVALFTWASQKYQKMSATFAYGALACYLLFIVTLLISNVS